MKMNQVCPLIKEWKTETLNLSKRVLESEWNHFPTILREIKEVRFPDLKQICLSKNSLESVEGLNKIRLPKLEKFWISTFSNI